LERGGWSGIRGKFTDEVLEVIDEFGEAIAIYDSKDRLVFFNQAFLTINPNAQEFVDEGKTYEDGLRINVGLGKVIEAHGREEEFIQQRVREHQNPKRGVTVRDYTDGRRLLIKEARTRNGGIVLTISEATDLREAEEALLRSEAALLESSNRAEAANRAKSAFLANMSHELRTPLNSIIGFSQIWMQQMFGPVDNTKYLEYAGDINYAGRHLLDIISDILDISKLEAGKLTPEFSRVSLDMAIESCMNMLRQRADSSGIELFYDRAISQDFVHADDRMLKQVIINIVGNALKFTPTGGRVSISVARPDSGSRIIEVSDTGIGIPPESIPLVLVPFGQVRDGAHISHEGTGLGLPLSNRLMELQGGRLDITSEPGCGTTVALTFPSAS